MANSYDRIIKLLKSHSRIIFIAFIIFCFRNNVLAQAPNISYSNVPSSFLINSNIGSYPPINSGGPIPLNTFQSVTTKQINLPSGALTPSYVAVGANGNVYMDDALGGGHLYKITTNNVLTAVISSATYSSQNWLTGLTFGANGNLFVLDYSRGLIIKIDTSTNKYHTFATDALLKHATDMAYNQKDNSLYAINGSSILKIPLADSSVATFFSSSNLGGLAFDPAGNLFIAQYDHISKIPYQNGKLDASNIIKYYAGVSGNTGSVDGPLAIAQFNGAYSLAFDNSGNGFVADQYNGTIRQINTSTGIVSTIAGVAGSISNLDGIGNAARFNSPIRIAFDPSGNLYVSEGNYKYLRKISLTGYTISPSLPTGLTFDSPTGLVSGKPTVTAPLTKYTVTGYNTYGFDTTSFTFKVASTNQTNDNLSSLIIIGGFKISPTFSSSTTIYSASVPYSTLGVFIKPTTSDANATVTVNNNSVSYGSSSQYIPLSVGSSNTETILVTAADGITKKSYILTINRLSTTSAPAISYNNNLKFDINLPIQQLSPTNTGGSIPSNTYQSVETISNTNFSRPSGLAYDAQGNLYVANTAGNNILKVDTLGQVTVFAGSSKNTAGNTNGTSLLTALFSAPYGIVFDGAGNFYVSEQGGNNYHDIRMISTSLGKVTTLAGSGNKNHKDGSLLSAEFYTPSGIAYDPINNILYVADQGSNLSSGSESIRKIDIGNNSVTTLTGVTFVGPRDLAIDLSKSILYVSDNYNSANNHHGAIIRLKYSSGTNSVIASSVIANNGTSPNNIINKPYGLALDQQNILWVAEYSNNIVYSISSPDTAPSLTYFAGNTSFTSGSSNGIGNSASFNNPIGIAIDVNGNLFVSDNNGIRKVYTNGYIIDTISNSNKLPLGLNFDGKTGIITGTPTIAFKTYNYTITGYNSGGSSKYILTFKTGISDSTFWTNSTNNHAWETLGNWSNGIPSKTKAPIFNISDTIKVASGTYANSTFPYFKVGGTGTKINIIQTNFADALSLLDTLQITKGNSLNIVNSGNLLFPKLVNFGNLNLTGCNGIINTPNGIINEGTINLLSNKNLNPIVSSKITIDSIFNNNGNFNILGGSTLILGNKNNCQLINNGVFQITDSQVQFPTNFTGSKISNGGGTTTVPDTAWFYVSPKSQISINDPTQTIVNNNPSLTNTITGEFVLQSDSNYSASIIFPTNQTTTLNASGKFRVQRFITGKKLPSYRGYRLISSPVNATSADPSTIQNNSVDYGYLNTSWMDGNKNKYYGAATAGPGGTNNGFSLTGPYGNTGLYLYREDFNPPNPATSAYDAYSTKYPGITSINGFNTNNPMLGWLSDIPGLVTNTGLQKIFPGNGLLLFYFGPNTRTDVSSATPPDNATITFFGYLNQGVFPCHLWFTPSVNTMSFASTNLSDRGISLVGNPYPSMIDLNQVYLDNQDQGFTTFYVLDNLTHNYLSYNAANGQSNSVNPPQYIASGQGFFVTASGLNKTLTFNPDQQYYDSSDSTLTSFSNPAGILLLNGGTIPTVDKNEAISRDLNNNEPLVKNEISYTTNKTNRKKAKNLNGMHLMLKLDNLNYCETGIYFDKIWTDKFDNNDAGDLEASGQKVFLSSYTSDGKRVSINSLNSYLEESQKIIKLYVKATNDGSYNLSISDMSNIDTTLTKINLIDNYKSSIIDLTNTKIYNFNILNADTNSYGANRFEIEFTTKPLPPFKLLSFNALSTINSININWTAQNEGTFTSFGLQKLNSKNTFSTIDSLQGNGNGSYKFVDTNPQIGNNTYRLVQNDVNGNVTYSSVQTVKFGSILKSKELTIYPNPVINYTTIDYSALATQLNSLFTIDVYDTNGKLQTETTSNQNSSILNLSSLKPGLYIVNVKMNGVNITGGRATFIKN